MSAPFSALEKTFGSFVHVRNFGRSERFVIEVDFNKLVEVAAWLRMEEMQRMDFLEAFTIYEARGKFVLSYFLCSNPHGTRMVLRSSIQVPSEKEWIEIPSVIGIWPHAEPFENELASLFGIHFKGSKGTGGVRKSFGTFSGFPLRKSFFWNERDEL